MNPKDCIYSLIGWIEEYHGRESIVFGILLMVISAPGLLQGEYFAYIIGFIITLHGINESKIDRLKANLGDLSSK